MKNPFFSIIIVSFNAENLIKKTIESVLSQSFDDYEIIVKDACSTDKTLKQIPKSDKIAVYSTKDKGIYDGMNEAISYASGKYLFFLNCGDYLASPDVLLRICETAKANSEENSVIYGDYCRSGVKFKQPSALASFYLYKTPLCHQTVFFGIGLFKKYGKYNVEFKILADYDFTLKIYRGGAKFVYCPIIVCDYLGGGVSENVKGKHIKHQEYTEICDLYFSVKEQQKFNFKLALSLKGLRQKMVGDSAPKWIRKAYRMIINIVNK